MRILEFVTRGLAATSLLLALCLPAFAIPQLLVDMRTGEVLYADDAGVPWHPASLTKLMTAFVTFEALAAGRLRLDTPVIISANALSAPPSKIGAPVDTAYALEDALYLMIVKSANDVSIAIAETVGGTEARFVNEMNATAAALGMTATRFINPNGLHDPAQVTSARDLAILAINLRQKYPQFAPMFATESVRLGQARLRSHNNLLTRFAGTTGMKTGYVCASGLNIVATVERQGKSLMAIVLGGSSSRERGELTAQLFLSALSGSLPGTGQIVTAITNRQDAPFNMRPFICGSEARTYVAGRAEAFPLGLEGQPTNLNDTIEATVRRVSSMGRIRNAPLPRPRPLWAPGPRTVAVTTAEPAVPLPRPRPVVRAILRAGL